MKKSFLLAIAAIFISIVLIVNAQDIPTEINVPNAAPILTELIPNQTWEKNNNNTNAFDLDDYFSDPNGDELNYSYTYVENITIIINETTNQVSFYLDYNFTGIRSVIFNASDGPFATDSNNVTLTVGEDIEPPQWSSPLKSKTNVYQSDYVNFTTIWTDNYGLGYYIFSVNQGSGWANYSSANFTGLVNTSFYRIQISAAAGNQISWMFYAFDRMGNANFTSVQTFNVSSRPALPATPDEEGESIGYVGYPAKKEYITNFTIDPDSFKVSLKQGESKTRILTITNIGTTNLTFNLTTSLQEFVILSEAEFSINAGGSKEITIDFRTKNNTPVEQYFGSIIINSTESRIVPVVIDVNAINIDFDIKIEIPENYKAVRPGEQVLANITIRNIKDIEPTKITLYIAVKDFFGNIYDSKEEQLTLTNSLKLYKNLTMPENSREGQYIFYGRVSDDENTAIDSDTFEVGVRFRFAAFIKSGLIFFIIGILSFLLAILMIKYNRDKEKRKILRLYLMLNELKNLIQENKIDKAVELYIIIKNTYKEPISKDILENKDKLKEEIKKLAEKLEKQEIPHPSPESKKESEKSETEDKDKEETEEKDKEETEEKDKEEQTQEKEKEQDEETEKKPEDKDEQTEKTQENKKKEEESKSGEENKTKQTQETEQEQQTPEKEKDKEETEKEENSIKEKAGKEEKDKEEQTQEKNKQNEEKAGKKPIKKPKKKKTKSRKKSKKKTKTKTKKPKKKKTKSRKKSKKKK